MRNERERATQVVQPSAVIFDVGDTLLQETSFDLEAGIRAVLTGDQSRVLELADGFRGYARDAHAVHRDIRLSTWLRAEVPALGARSDDSVEDALWKAVVTLVPRTGVAPVLDRLREDGVAVAAISNASFSSRILYRELERHGLGATLSFVLSSGDSGHRKPAPEIFRDALARLGSPADRTWFVGDTFEEDMLGAIGAGLVPVWMQSGAAAPSHFPPVVHVQDWTDLATLYASCRSSPVST